METPHFELHYHQGEHALALRAARMAELAHKRLVPLLDHEPSERCHIVISDDTDFANGSATPLLRNTITLNAAPPDARSTLNDFDDYVWELVSHEYTHILHLDTLSGLPEVTNKIFGKLWIPNGAQPRWFVEGLAVFEESEQSAAGRERSSQEEMAVRSQVLDGTFPTISQLSNLPLVWPRGDVWYTLGGRFVAFIGDHYGAGALRDLSHDYGSRPIPFGLNLSAEKILGKSYLTLYEEFQREEVERALDVVEDVREQGETRIERLTALGERTRSPRFSHDGTRVYYASQGADRLPELRELTLPPCCEVERKLDKPTQAGDRHLIDTYGDSTLSVAGNGRLVYAREQYFQRHDELEDLSEFDPRTGGERRVTRGLRASEPDVAPDGTIVFIWRRPGGRTAVAELSPGATEPRVLFEDPALEPVGAPRLSPDGERVAFTHHRGGNWDIQVVTRADLSLIDITKDRSIERDPAWTPDGGSVVFSSDRSGVYDLYACRIADRSLTRLTRVVTGAFEPSVSPDGTQLLFVTYSGRGFDLARIPYPNSTELKTPGVAANERPAPLAEPARDLFPAHPYQPLQTLRPYYWLPFTATDALGNTVGALTTGSDIVGLHEYTAEAWWAIDSHQPGFSFSYTNHTLYPDLTFTASRDVSDVANIGCVQLTDGSVRCASQRDLHAGARADFSFPNLERSWSFDLGYDLDHLANNTVVPDLAPRQGFIGQLYGGISYSDAKRFVRSISSEQGLRASLSLRLADPKLGGDYTYRLATAAISKYFALPWSWNGRSLHHVLALRTASGFGVSDISPAHLFSLGGFGITDPVRTFLNLADAPVRVLRGFRNSSFYGDAYALGSAEYRFPITDVEIGAWTLPLYLRRLHAAVFADGGDAFDYRRDNRTNHHDFKFHAGVGGELRAEVVLGYVLPTDVRAGCARGLESSFQAIFDCYLALGGIF